MCTETLCVGLSATPYRNDLIIVLRQRIVALADTVPHGYSVACVTNYIAFTAQHRNTTKRVVAEMLFQQREV